MFNQLDDDGLVFEDSLYRGHWLKVAVVSKEKLAPAFGLAKGGIHQDVCRAYVREDLSPLVQRFVRAHELYHLIDTSNFMGAYGREFRANFFPGLADPIGLVACIFATVFSWERFKFYCHRFWYGY